MRTGPIARTIERNAYYVVLPVLLDRYSTISIRYCLYLYLVDIVGRRQFSLGEGYLTFPCNIHSP